ncbi:hypothetical protein F9U64_20385 [Gracilibacillus oryzae]|uniref:Uncharacterized protein n=1 Tax=Gracilibacillus oryzae TaxID=1672701 RepID=A0A7C8KMK2_9BACI|nr:hypothetical protein [Gracilibacillus oryzae]KAB8126205.1 hypothetical protein F9U64_20385 [Gracilibacillus oryzae]
MYYVTHPYPCNHYPMGHYFNHPAYHPFRQYPEVDTSIFEQSVVSFKEMNKQSAVILDKFAEHEYAQRLMKAAQSGNQSEVDNLIKSIGVSPSIKTKYTPSGILLTISEDNPCCVLTMFLRWGN